MANLVKDRNIVVMGVANKWSIAWAIAKKLHQEGANLLFTYNDDRSLKSLEKLMAEEGMSCKAIPCDVTKDEDIEYAFGQIKEEMKQLDGVVHSIAHAKKEELTGTYVDTSRDGFQLAHDISVYSLVKVAKEASSMMTDGGSIVTLTYLGGEKVVKNYNVMGVAKASLDASVRYLAVDLGKKGIRVNGISAGPIKTLAAKGISGFNEIVHVYEEKAPLQRMISADEVAGSALFLMSDLSSAVTGETLHVDAGYNIVAY